MRPRCAGYRFPMLALAIGVQPHAVEIILTGLGLLALDVLVSVGLLVGWLFSGAELRAARGWEIVNWALLGLDVVLVGAGFYADFGANSVAGLMPLLIPRIAFLISRTRSRQQRNI